MLSPEEKKKVAQIKQDPSVQAKIKGMTDEEILAQYRFVEEGAGIEVYDSEEAWRAARKKKRIDEIDEI